MAATTPVRPVFSLAIFSAASMDSVPELLMNTRFMPSGTMTNQIALRAICGLCPTFWGEIDRQHVLPFGTTDDVREAVMRVRRALDDGTGSLIVQCEWGKDNTKENIEAVFRSWSE